MSERVIDAVTVWEEMMAEMDRPDVNDKSVRTYGRWLNNYRETNGTAEIWQLAVNLAEPADDMWRMFEPAHGSDCPFYWGWIPKWLQALHEISADFSYTKRWEHIVAGLVASYNMDLDDEEEMHDRFHHLSEFHCEHKMLLRDKSDGKLFVEDNDPNDPDALDRFWGVYGYDAYGYAMHVCDVRTQTEAEEVINAINYWLKREEYAPCQK